MSLDSLQGISIVRSVLAAGRGSLEVDLGCTDFVFGLVAEVLNAVTTVQGLSDLLVGLHESLELDVELSVLAGQYIAVVLEGLDFGTGVVVAAAK